MLRTDDIITELDIVALDNDVLTVFGNTLTAVQTNLAGKRTVVVHDWIYSRMIKAGYSPHRHSVRFAPSQAWGFTTGAYTDLTSALTDKTLDDVSLPALFSTPGSDFLYVGHPEAPRGAWLTMHDTPNVNSLTIATFQYWTGSGWSSFTSLVDGTLSNSVSFAGGGRIAWQQPENWAKRSVNSESTWRYWLRIGTNRTPSVSSALSQALPINRSRLTLPAVYKALAFVYGESWAAQRGEWKEKARDYDAMAESLMVDALISLDEFTLPDEEQIVPSSPAGPPDQSLFIIERG